MTTHSHLYPNCPFIGEWILLLFEIIFLRRHLKAKVFKNQLRNQEAFRLASIRLKIICKLSVRNYRQNVEKRMLMCIHNKVHRYIIKCYHFKNVLKIIILSIL